MKLGGDEPSNKFTEVWFGLEARVKLFKGLEVAANAVACTMGPKGKCVIIQREGQIPIVTKDGCTVAKHINLKDPVARMGAQLICEAATRTNDVAGDGTTTATVLTHAMVEESMKLLSAKANSTELKQGVEYATKQVISNLRQMSKKVETVEEVKQVGTISANGDSTIGGLIAEAMEKVGRDGIITVEDAKGMTTSMEVVEGMQFERGYLSPYFVTHPEKMQAMYEGACVLLTPKKLSNLQELVPVLEEVQKNNRALLIIADDVEGEALSGLILNRVRGNLKVIAIKAPGFGNLRDQLLEDIAVLTGAKVFSSSSGLALKDAKLVHLGHTKKVVVDSKTVTIVGAGKSASEVTKRTSDLRMQLEDVTLTGDEQEILRMRIAKLSSGCAIIKVGGATELEMTERKYRIEDALNATRAAVEEGIVPGGGAALLYAARHIFPKLEPKEQPTWTDSFKQGVKLVEKACLAPLQQIAKNASASANMILALMEENVSPIGWNAVTGKYVDMFEAGVIDPVKVSRNALENASSVACTFISLNAIIQQEDGT